MKLGLAWKKPTVTTVEPTAPDDPGPLVVITQPEFAGPLRQQVVVESRAPVDRDDEHA